MKTKFLFIGLMLPTFLLISCNADSELDKLKWLIGDWEYNFEGGRTVEGWQKNTEGQLDGYSYTLMGGDTVSQETILIKVKDGNMNYVPTVMEQNDGQPIEFAMIELSDSTVVFENKAHDFPQKIQYKKIGSDSLEAKISGPIQGSTENLEVKFPMRRIK